MAEPNANDSNISGGSDSDQDFDPSAEMLVNDFDDEHTLDEEEALADDDDELTNKDEIDKLNEEKDIPIEELLRMYGYDKPQTTSDNNNNNNDQSTSDSSNSNNLTSQSQQTTSSTTTTVNNNNNSINQLLSDSSDDDSDEDFSDNENEWRRTIQVGSDFQAVIPEGLKHYEQDSTIGNNNTLLWKPQSTSILNLDEYLLEYAKLSLSGDEDSLNDFILPTGAHIKDDEQALYLLFQCKYDMRKALHLHENDDEPKAPISEPMTPWTEEECRAFESGLRALGKDFYQIKHSRIPTRSVGEVISFYYLWKKTERHDIFANKFRIEKKKYSLHPGTTDYMDRFLDEQENVSSNMPLNNSNTMTSTNVQINVQQPQTQNNSSSSIQHHGMNVSSQQPQSSSSSSSNRQSLHSQQAQTSSNFYPHHSHHHTNNNNTSMSLGRTIQVSSEPQTILINDYHVSTNDDKPIVVCTGNSGGIGSSNRGNYFGTNNESSNTTTIVVGKNPVVIDGTWVSSSSSSSASAPLVTSSSSSSSSVASTNLTPSVSIYKISHNSSYNR